jgi:hypothetical protein
MGGNRPVDGRMVEEWKDIPGFDGDYQVSTTGRVKSFKQHSEGMILKQYADRYGYLKVVLLNGGKPHYFTVHRLVAMTFLEKPEGKNEVDHIDCNRQNNNVENLRWCSNTENLFYSHEKGRQYMNATPLVAVSPEGEEMRFRSQRYAEKITGISQRSIWRCLNGERTSVYGWTFKMEVKDAEIS